MFGYVRPSVRRLSQEDQDRFSSMYCGLCHTLQRRYGLAARMILNYDLTFLAILLQDGTDCSGGCRRCVVHPLKKRPCAGQSQALDTAADYSVILSWWQIQDGIADHGFWGALKYRLAGWLLGGAYRKARKVRPDFDENTRRHLEELAQLEKEGCPSIDRPADTFARLLSGAAGEVKEGSRRRVLQQMLYHLGRWIYLTDAADDLSKDLRSGSYNPLPLRFGVENGALTPEGREALAQTMDRSVEMMAAAFELADFGVWTEMIRSVVYEGLYAVGGAVLNGTFHRRRKDREETQHER